ncbi:MAG: HAMP domain-containing histidine kinase [Clostridia bacterium]|nr:HAMP domain-containing histidine kinase [Clostridia bacterium]
MNKNEKQHKFRIKGNHRLTLTILFTVVVALLIWVTTSLAFLITRGLRASPLFSVGHVPPHTYSYVFVLICVVIGSVLSVLCVRTIMRPLLILMDAFDEVSMGNYAVRVPTKGFLRLMKIGERFNKMAEQLGNVEIMQNEFIDNFSHEFKTPLSSMKGFAELLKQENLTAEQRDEYAGIISSEAKRLSKLSSTVLMLSKVEKQAILTNITDCNIAEQIRRVIALLDTKWSEKELDIILDAPDVTVPGNESLLSEVWINLLDNAIKYSDPKSQVQIRITPNDEFVSVRFSNTGEPMNETTKKRMFDKFYQQDTAHATQGYGLGMPIVKKIVSLHKGDIRIVETGSFTTTIEVILYNTIPD